MHNKRFFVGILSILMIFGLFLAACSSSTTTVTYTITFNTNGGSGWISPQTVEKDNGIWLPDGSALSWDGYYFAGWNTNPYGYGNQYSPYEWFVPTGDITLYAQWDTAPPNYSGYYEVSFDSNRGSGSVPSQTVRAGDETWFPSGNNLSRNGFSFEGWNTNSAGTGILYRAYEWFIPTGDITFYAHWTAVDRPEGVYVGIITFAEGAEELTSSGPIFLNSSSRYSLTNMIDTYYNISSYPGTALFYGVHKALANLTANEDGYPQNLDSVNIITFTDGLDNSSGGLSAFSPIEGKSFDTATEYADYVNDEIQTRKIAGIPITAYSVGVKGSDVEDEARFKSDLAKIASSGKSYELTNFSDIQDTFNDIAKNLTIVGDTTTDFYMITTLLDNGTKVRMTFDVTGTDSASATASTRWIEGTINRSGTTYTFTNITYSSGIASKAGASITGEVINNNTAVSFKFDGITGYNPAIDSAKQWLWYSGASSWQYNTEYNAAGSSETEYDYRSAIIYFVLDRSRSLQHDEIEQIKTAVKSFIQSLN